MAMADVLGETAMDSSLKMFSTYQVEYNWDRMETYRKRGKRAGDMFILKMGLPKRSKPIHDKWNMNKDLFWMNDYTPQIKPTDSVCRYTYRGPTTEKERSVCRKYLKKLESKMCMPPGLNEPLIWENTHVPPRKQPRLPTVLLQNTKKSKVLAYKDKFFLEVQPEHKNNFDIHPEFSSERIKNKMKTGYWQDGTIFTEPKKPHQITDMPL